MVEKKIGGGNLPALGSRKGMPTIGGKTQSGLPVIGKGTHVAPSNPGESILQQRAAQTVDTAMSTSAVDVAGILDFTASTSDLRDGFIERIGAIVQKNRPGVDVTFQPVVFNGNGDAIRGDHGDSNFYNTQSNIAGNTYINNGIDAALEGLDGTNPGVFVVLTDDPTNHDPSTYGERAPNKTLSKLQESDTLLLCIIDTSSNNADFEEIVQSYRQTYGELGGNLIVVGGATDANAIVDKFIDAKAIASINGRKSVDKSSLPNLLSNLGGDGNLQIGTGDSSTILKIGKS